MKKLYEILEKNKKWYRGFAFGLAVAVLLTSFQPVRAGISDSTEAAIEAFATFFGLGNEAIHPSEEEFDEASLVEKVNYLKDEVEALKNQSSDEKWLDFRTASWSEIQKACKDGKAYEYFKVGDEKLVKMDAFRPLSNYKEKYDLRTCNPLYAHVRIFSLSPTGMTCVVTGYASTTGVKAVIDAETKYSNSYFRSWLLDDYYNAFDKELRDVIVKEDEFSDYLWYPSHSIYKEILSERAREWNMAFMTSTIQAYTNSKLRGYKAVCPYGDSVYMAGERAPVYPFFYIK